MSTKDSLVDGDLANFIQEFPTKRALGGPATYFTLLKAVCNEITDAPGGINDEHFISLYQLLGKSLLAKSLDVVDNQIIEFVNVIGMHIPYFVVRGIRKTYYLYTSDMFCTCPRFKFNVIENKINIMCKHIIACHIALANKNCTIRSSTEPMPSIIEGN